jgi:hypothetical protein
MIFHETIGEQDGSVLRFLTRSVLHHQPVTIAGGGAFEIIR